MSSIIKWFTGRNLESPEVEVFTPVKRGESSFDYQSFDGEKSVQDESADPNRQALRMQHMLSSNPSAADFSFSGVDRPRMFSSYDDTPVQASPSSSPSASTPSRPRLFAAYDDDDDYTPPAQSGADRPRLFGSYEPDDDEVDYSKQKAEAGALLESEPVAQDGFQEVTFEEAELADVKLLESQKELLEKNAELTALQEELDKAKAEIETLKDNQNTLQEQIDSIPGLQEASRQEGYNEAKGEFEKKEKAEYQAQQKDYLATVEKSWQEADAELAKLNDTIAALDDEMPQIVVAYVRQIIGEERKLNDTLVVNVVKGALSQLKDLQQIVFNVNPDDAAIMADKFPQYGVSIDPSIPKGSVKVRTKIGEINLSVDSWVDNLEQQIHEQIALAQNDQAN